MRSSISKALVAGVAGLVFGAGLTIADMTNPYKVISFLNVAGQWDPSLALVLAAALMTTLVGFRFVFRRSSPILEAEFYLPSFTAVDRPLLFGAILFGVGWGLVGLCPGPAVAALSIGGHKVVIFVASMFAGILLHDLTGLKNRLFST